MEQLYAWVRNITFYMILISVVTNLLPSKKYEKYLHLFLGMVLILLVLQPLTGSLRLEERIAYYFSMINFKNQAGDLEKEFIGAEQDRLDRMVAQYEEAVAMDLEQMARDTGFYPVTCSAEIGSDPDGEDFGKVSRIFLAVSLKEPGDGTADGAAGAFTEGRREKEPIAAVEPVRIGSDGAEGDVALQDDVERDVAPRDGAEGNEALQDEAEGDGGQQGGGAQQQGTTDGEAQDKLRALRRKIGEYYSLEEAYVEIQLENG